MTRHFGIGDRIQVRARLAGQSPDIPPKADRPASGFARRWSGSGRNGEIRRALDPKPP